MDEYEIISSKIVFEGRILNIKHDEVKTPTGAKWFREVVVSRQACAVVPVDENGDIILVRQYRHPVRRMTLEIPAGIVEYGETPEEGALRELKEETGYTASKLTYLTGLQTAIGFCTEMIRVYIASGLKAGDQKLDPDELVTVHKYSAHDVVRMIADGTIQDAKTISGVLMYLSIKTDKM